MSPEMSVPAETEPEHHAQAAAVVLEFANRTTPAAAVEVRPPTDVPHHPTDSWALKGNHNGWIGFDRTTGQPK